MSRLLAALLLIVGALCGPALADERPHLDVRVLARVPAPGYPSLAHVTADRTVWVGTFTGLRDPGGAPSKVFGFSPSGKLLRTFTIRGQTAGAVHGVQVAEHDRAGRLYLLDQHPARVVLLDPRTGRQRTWATFADVPTCGAAQRPTDCSNTVQDNEPEPDYAAWLPDGSLLVTDYLQGLLWRVPPGGGRARVWINDPRLDGLQFGPAGLVALPGGRELVLSTSAGGVTTDAHPTTGKLYRLFLDGAGHLLRMTQFWQSGPAEAPDGFAVARTGHVYLALVGPAGNTVVELDRRGRELARVPLDPGQQVPFDAPSSVQFLDERLVVTNSAYFSGDPAHMVLFDLQAGERGAAHQLPRP